jgi:Protein of unknown function (DUF3592)
MKATNQSHAARQLRRALAGALLMLMALGLWWSRGVVSSWFATSYTATLQLRTTNERDDARVQRAFAAAHAAQSGDATFELLPGMSLIRHSAVHVTGTSRSEAIAAAKSLSQLIVDAFNAEGPGQLDVGAPRRAEPLPNSASAAVLAILAFGAPMLGLAGIALLGLGWRDWPADPNGTPRSVVFGAIGVCVMGILPFAMPAWVFMALFAMAIPIAVAGRIVYKMREVRRAALWPSAQGRIVQSRMRALQRQQGEHATTVINVPDIEYVYSVGGIEYKGHRISIGDIPAGSRQVEAALERYCVGRTGPVFYNPENPADAVLERDPPARPAVVYGVAAAVMLVGLAVVVAFTRAVEIIDGLQPYFPPGAVVQGVLFFTAAGILTTLSFASDMRRAAAAARWPTMTGTILSSIAESHRSLVPGGRGQTVTQWSPVVEYSYRVQGRDYHGSRLAFGADVAGPRDFAEAIVARYPAGREVTVHFDPANPSFAVLEPRVALAWPTLMLTIAFFAAALFFSGWRGFS